jgi:hypothetical protein
MRTRTFILIGCIIALLFHSLMAWPDYRRDCDLGLASDTTVGLVKFLFLEPFEHWAHFLPFLIFFVIFPLGSLALLHKYRKGQWVVLSALAMFTFLGICETLWAGDVFFAGVFYFMLFPIIFCVVLLYKFLSNRKVRP